MEYSLLYRPLPDYVERHDCPSKQVITHFIVGILYFISLFILFIVPLLILGITNIIRYSTCTFVTWLVALLCIQHCEKPPTGYNACMVIVAYACLALSMNYMIIYDA